MALMRYDPFRELDRLTHQLLDSTPRSALLPMDAYRRGDRFAIAIDVPGVDPGSIEVTVEKNVLSVRAERSFTPAEGDEVVVAERPQGTFSRQLFLGENLDTDQIEAAYENGVLRLGIPVAESAKPRRVEVTSAVGSAGTVKVG